MTAQITPGPWQIKDDYTREGRFTIIANVDLGKVDFVASLIDEYDETTECVAANRAAILAVPAMIEALQRVAKSDLGPQSKAIVLAALKLAGIEP